MNELQRDIEKAFDGKYRKTILRPFFAAMKEFDLVKEGDRIAVCVSGGKDSMLLAKCMQQYRRRSPLHFELIFLCMDPGFAPVNRREIEETAEKIGIPLTFFETDVFEAADAAEGSPCQICAKMRRGYLYRRAQMLGCNKIALGHHFDDAAETLMMSILYSGQIRGMRPRLKSENVPGMELIRPLYRVRESDICAWRDEFGLRFSQCACRVTRSGGEADSKRAEIKRLLRDLEKTNPDAVRNIFRAAYNVVPSSLIGWREDGQRHLYMEQPNTKEE